jgi:hypothetical protein
MLVYIHGVADRAKHFSGSISMRVRANDDQSSKQGHQQDHVALLHRLVLCTYSISSRSFPFAMTALGVFSA